MNKAWEIAHEALTKAGWTHVGEAEHIRYQSNGFVIDIEPHHPGEVGVFAPMGGTHCYVRVPAQDVGEAAAVLRESVAKLRGFIQGWRDARFRR